MKPILQLLSIACLTLWLSACQDEFVSLNQGDDFHHTANGYADSEYPEHCMVSVGNHLFKAGGETKREACIKASELCMNWTAANRERYLDTYICQENSYSRTKGWGPMKKILSAY